MMEYPLFPVGGGPTVRGCRCVSVRVFTRAHPISLRLQMSDEDEKRTSERARARSRVSGAFYARAALSV